MLAASVEVPEEYLASPRNMGGDNCLLADLNGLLLVSGDWWEAVGVEVQVKVRKVVK